MEPSSDAISGAPLNVLRMLTSPAIQAGLVDRPQVSEAGWPAGGRGRFLAVRGAAGAEFCGQLLKKARRSPGNLWLRLHWPNAGVRFLGPPADGGGRRASRLLPCTMRRSVSRFSVAVDILNSSPNFAVGPRFSTTDTGEILDGKMLWLSRVRLSQTGRRSTRLEAAWMLHP